MKILYLPLKAKWYNMIDSGEKPEEYRENKLYWCKRLYKNGDRTTQEFKPYTHVTFSYGYTKRRMTFEIKKILLAFGKTEWGAPSNKLVFTIQLGKRERKVGEIFSYKCKTIKVVESDFCVGCYFIDFCRRFNGKLPAGLCFKVSRSDEKSVIFKEVLK